MLQRYNDPDYIDIWEAKDFDVIKIQLTINRLMKPERRNRCKSIDPQDAEDNGPLLSIVHPNLLVLEISGLKPDPA